MWMGWVWMKTVLKNAQTERGGAYRNSIDLYEHGMRVSIARIDTSS